MNLQKKDLLQLHQRKINLDVVERQIQHFIQGFPYLKIAKAATLGDGIQLIDSNLTKQYIELYERESLKVKTLKFVPASGAASRMFQDLFNFLEATPTEQKALLEKKSFYSVGYFFDHLKSFAFFETLQQTLAEQGKNLRQLLDNQDFTTVLNALLTEQGMSYGNLPKALLQFHRYDENARTPIEEHLIEAVHYCLSDKRTAFLHFTVSPEHLDNFKQTLSQVYAQYEDRFEVSFEISFSVQATSTDTIAVDLNNQPFRDDAGNLLFRPAGHGALLNNLNDLDADLVFIKNVDNVVPDRLKQETFDYKKLIGGVLMAYQGKIFDFLRRLDDAKENSQIAALVAEIERFYDDELCLQMPKAYLKQPIEEKVEWLYNKLNRPIRVCGMVKNEGEPGGGPFWATNPDGSVSLQIVESSQIDPKHIEQQTILKSSSHFNPVDLVCGLKNYEGEKFNLKDFTDPLTGFISQKSYNGRSLKAQELPGLWNGAMSDWNTVFVEVPLITFNPVKKVNDLLRAEHQAN